MGNGDGEASALGPIVDAPAESSADFEPFSSCSSLSVSSRVPYPEAFDDSPSRDPGIISTGEPSPSAEVSTGLSHDPQPCTTSQSLAEPLQVCIPSLPETPAAPAGSSPAILFGELESSSSSSLPSSDEQGSLSLEASPRLLRDAITPEELCQDASTQLRSCDSNPLSAREPLAEESFPAAPHSENSLSHTNTMEGAPSEAFSQEEANCMEAEHELSEDVKRQMLTDICKGVSILSCKSDAPAGDCSVYIIGTAHVSEESCREVQAAVRLVKPQVVFLELCQKRTAILQRTSFVVPTVSDMIAMWKQRKTNMLGIVYSWFLAKVAAKLEIRPGSEFRAAYEEALVCGAKVVLGDRDIEITLRRTWGKLSVWHKTKLISLMLYQSLFLPKADQLNELIEKLKDADILTIAFEELGKFSPALMETLINERDMFMTAALQKIAEHHSSIVAVVGRGHVAGITKYWGQDIPIRTLLEIPGRKSVLGLRLRTYAVIASVAVASVVVLAFR